MGDVTHFSSFHGGTDELRGDVDRGSVRGHRRESAAWTDHAQEYRPRAHRPSEIAAPLSSLSEDEEKRLQGFVKEVDDARYNKMIIEYATDYCSAEQKDVCLKLKHWLEMRDKYMRPLTVRRSRPGDGPLTCAIEKGVFAVKGDSYTCITIPDIFEYYGDLSELRDFRNSGPARTYCYSRLKLLEQKYTMYMMLNQGLEDWKTRHDPRDFFNIHKVDNHIHLAAAMSAKHLLTFMKDKANEEPDLVVSLDENGKPITLLEAFESLDITPDTLSIDRLNVSATARTFYRFDKFNNNYNPAGSSLLREIFLKTSNHFGGRFFAELTHQIVDSVRANGECCIHIEPRVSIYGRAESEWSELADWFVDNGFADPSRGYDKSLTWLIQVPRLYGVLRRQGNIGSFQEYLTHLFNPLFECSVHPDRNPKLATLLNNICGFDSVDDESGYDDLIPVQVVTPDEYTDVHNPPYSYYMYYMYANIRSLNNLRASLGLNTYAFRPHCGESGETHHLSSAYLVVDGVNHGIQLQNAPVMQYLYYLTQIPLSISPLSNNALFVQYPNNPFRKLHARGLCVALSTDDPLQFHMTENSLIEEYAMAKQHWKLDTTDLSEIARNSVLMSGFPDSVKREWLGKNFKLPGYAGNDLQYTNVPNIRVAFRHDTWMDEMKGIAWGLDEDITVNGNLHIPNPRNEKKSRSHSPAIH